SRATRAAAVAEQSAAEAKAEKVRADESAAIAQRNADDARAQRDRAEREALQAARQAQRSDARAELIQSQFILRDAPREALARAYEAAQKLDSLGAANEALPLLGTVVNTARELPPRKFYSEYNLRGATVFARQATPKNTTKAPISGRLSSKLRTVIGSNNVT